MEPALAPENVSAASKACPLCGGSDFTKLYTLADPAFATVRCRACRFVFMNPYPTDDFLHAHYLSTKLYGFWSEDPEAYRRSIDDRIILFRTLFRNAKLSLGGYAVDFGAGIGIAVAALKQIGFDAVGIDKNSQAAAVGKALFDVEIRDCDLDALGRTIELFTLFDVLEHIKYPKDFLKRVSRNMAGGAIVIGAVPNFDGIGRLLRGTESASLIFPEHVNQFTRHSLRKTLLDSGFEPLYVGFPPPYGVTLTIGLRAKLRRLFGTGPTIGFASKMLVYLKRYVIYPLPNFFAERTGLLGHSMVFVARLRHFQ